MTDAMSALAHAIAQHRRDRATATKLRGEETADRSRAVASQLREARAAFTRHARDYRATAEAANEQRHMTVGALLAANRHRRMTRHGQRLEMATAQHRQLATFMSDLTADVGTMRDKFRAHLARDRRAQSSALASFAANLATDVGAMRAGMRARHRAMSQDLHQLLRNATRDRHGATEAWRGRTATPPATTPPSFPPPLFQASGMAGEGPAETEYGMAS
jgi:hypothetical protein